MMDMFRLKRRLISLGHSETDADWAVTEEEGYSTKAPLTEGSTSKHKL